MLTLVLTPCYCSHMNGYELTTEALDLDASEPVNLNPSDFKTGDHVLWTLSLIERIYGA